VQTGNPELVAAIRDAIDRAGPVTFEWFMEQALYHPELGYYSSDRAQIGRRGDYFTNVSVGPLFGRMMATQFCEMWETLGRPPNFAVVEQGSHHGDFAKDVLETVRAEFPEFYAALRYSIVEPFPKLETRQGETLRDFQEKVSWRKSLEELEPFSGVHFSNELLDAMPVRLISREGTREWQERLVTNSHDGFAFVTGAILDEGLRRRLPDIPEPTEARYETEVCLGVLDWIEKLAAKLERGFVLGVDYGFPRQEFYDAGRNTGTLQGYAAHRPVASPLDEVGQADLTAHVEWASIVEHAEKCGLSLVGFTDQHHFLTGMLGRIEPRENERRALQTLMHPEFLGTRFQYLALGKGVQGQQLAGFRYARDGRGTLGF